MEWLFMMKTRSRVGVLDSGVETPMYTPGTCTQPLTWKVSSAMISRRGAMCLGSLPLFGYLAIVNQAEHM